MPVHFDHNHAPQTEFDKPLVDSTFTLALVTGQSVTNVSQNVFANLGWDEFWMPAPIFEGGTTSSSSQVFVGPVSVPRTVHQSKSSMGFVRDLLAEGSA
jgi:acyl dehydratase